MFIKTTVPIKNIYRNHKENSKSKGKMVVSYW